MYKSEWRWITCIIEAICHSILMLQVCLFFLFLINIMWIELVSARKTWVSYFRAIAHIRLVGCRGVCGSRELQCVVLMLYKQFSAFFSRLHFKTRNIFRFSSSFCYSFFDRAYRALNGPKNWKFNSCVALCVCNNLCNNLCLHTMQCTCLRKNQIPFMKKENQTPNEQVAHTLTDTDTQYVI